MSESQKKFLYYIIRKEVKKTFVFYNQKLKKYMDYINLKVKNISKLYN